MAVGYLLNNIIINRSDSSNNTSQVISVPVDFSPKEKMLTRLLSDPDLGRPYEALLPRISFNLEDVRPRREDQLPAVNYIAQKQANNSTRAMYQFTPVPFSFMYMATIWAKNIEDGCKIYEQILPFFTPDYTLRIKLVTEMNQTMNVPIILEAMTPKLEQSEKFTDRNTYTWDLQFHVKGYLYGPVRSAPLIIYANTNMFFYDPFKNDLTLPENPSVSIQDKPGLTANGQPTTNAAASVPANTIFLDQDYGFIEIKTLKEGDR